MNFGKWFTVVFCSLSLYAFAAPDFEGELIFPVQDKHVHGSSIVECPNGDLLACWFHGSGERSANDVKVNGARLKKGATEWSPMFEMADTPEFPDCNPVLFMDAQDRLWLFWIVVKANKWEHSLLKYRRAENYQGDGPPQWSWQDVISLPIGDEFPDAIKRGFDELDPPEDLWAEYAPQYSKMIIEAAQDKAKRQSGWMTRIHPAVLPSGRILLPLYSDGFNVSLAAISDDLGETWRPSLPMVGLGPIQPTIVRKKDGTLVAYLRDSGGAPSRAMMSTSNDDGMNWSVARDTDILNPGSSLEVIALKDGRWALVYNDTEDGRYQLALALSDNEGATWKSKRHLERAEKGQGSAFAYPSMIQAKNGKLHLSYSYSVKAGKSIKHVTLDPAWIEQAE
ncbi:MAG: exo-alpha-sialidase [Candidatus Hydrogenedentes bacterium]|nr:exo-alpha-sialidase [Candidatus Hydrogenedentota bacterium]